MSTTSDTRDDAKIRPELGTRHKNTSPEDETGRRNLQGRHTTNKPDVANSLLCVFRPQNDNECID